MESEVVLDRSAVPNSLDFSRGKPGQKKQMLPLTDPTRRNREADHVALHLPFTLEYCLTFPRTLP